MFTGIIEATGKVVEIRSEKSNLHFRLSCPFVQELNVDQSVSHNGVCLTVTDIANNSYEVTAIRETLEKSNLGELRIGHQVNLERCMPANGRFDGHIVQGHVDMKAKCTAVTDLEGSWQYDFELEQESENVLVEKGSVCINGVSLTCFNINGLAFSVAIIPYTFEHTNFQSLQPGNSVNIEFDIVGKYIRKLVG